MESANFINLVIAYYKDKIQKELLDKFKEESCRLLQADADARRMTAREDILTMAKLKMELEKFKLTYNQISSTCGSMDAIDSYIREIEIKIRQLSFKKNHPRIL